MRVVRGDARHIPLGAESVDAIVCDPPYGLSFMGKDWDHGVPGVPFWTEALRVLRPGGHLVAFGGTRTFHRLTCAIEDAGFEIRDCLSWLYGQGFPKSHNLDGEWDGWGTALKPAWEPIVLARKPLTGTVAQNVLANGTSALNIDGCRVATGDDLNGSAYQGNGARDTPFGLGNSGRDYARPSGRWPANLALDPEAAALLDEQSGKQRDGTAVRRNGGGGDFFGGINPRFNPNDDPWPDVGYGGGGGASRFFYCAKASRGEREAGLREAGQRKFASGGRTMRDGEWVELDTPFVPRANHHPTVKPIALMRWLCRLVTPPDGLILDPFAGSGTTGCAAVLGGFRFVGLDLEPEYVAIANARIAHWAGESPPPLASHRPPDKPKEQLGLFAGAA